MAKSEDFSIDEIKKLDQDDFINWLSTKMTDEDTLEILKGTIF